MIRIVAPPIPKPSDPFPKSDRLASVPPLLRRAARVAAKILLGLIIPGLILWLWQIAVTRGWLPEQLLPPPILVARSFRDLWDTGDLQANLLISLKRIGWSLLIGGSVGLAAGFGMGLSRSLRVYIQPTF